MSQARRVVPATTALVCETIAPARAGCQAGSHKAQPPVPRSVSDRTLIGVGEVDADRCGRGGALGVAEAAGAHAGRRVDVINDVVIAVVAVGRRVRDARWDEVEVKIVAYLPCDVVVGAGSVAAHAQAPEELPLRVVQR